jgi:hypothetical protein
VQWRRYGQAVFGLLRRRAVLLLAVAAVLLTVGRHFEQQTSLAHHELLEETAELLAFGLILQVALRLWLGTRRHSPWVHASGFGMAGVGVRRH